MGEQRTLNEFSELLPNIRLIREEEHQLLGSPVSAVVPVLQRKHKKLQGMNGRQKTTDTRSALVLENCFGILN